MVNCVLATVNEKPVTLFDLKVIRAFDLISEAQEGIYDQREKYLEVYVDQLLVRELVREQLKVTEVEIAQELKKIKERLGEQVFHSKLLQLGLREGDLKIYLEGKILFDKVIGSRFTQKSYVSLQEIEEYYQNEYVPQQQANGQKPAELLHVLVELEENLQKIKRRKEIREWMQELRQRADIIVNSDCLKKIEQQEEK
ncbi:MAG: hypothetical protein H5U07_01615 [Candidatus Aminicenantes bacterium]|nr:hypothetical protein [Candidatus Aminicenantes bacterium]